MCLTEKDLQQNLDYGGVATLYPLKVYNIKCAIHVRTDWWKKGGELLGMVKFPLSLQTPVKGSLEIYS